MGLFFDQGNKTGMVEYADAGYLSDPLSTKSQNGFMKVHHEWNNFLEVTKTEIDINI